MTRARDNSFNPFNNQVAGKNLVINGAFDIWQRGTSVTMGNAVYTADRWLSFTDSASNRTVTRQLTNDSVNLPNIQYCARVQRTAGDTGTGRYVIGGGNETSMSIPLAGQTVTLSFYARAGVNYSVSGNLLGVNLQYGTGTDQNIFVGYTGNTNLIATTKTLTTTWQRFSVTGTFPATATEIGWAFNSVGSPTGTAGANDYYEITGVQLELGPNATQFSRAGGTIGGELALCQRYYSKSYDIGTAPGAASAIVGAVSWSNPTTGANGQQVQIRFPVMMRIPPAVTIFSSSGTSGYMRNVSTAGEITAAVDIIGNHGCTVYPTSSTGGAAGYWMAVQYAASAEL